MTKKLLDHVRLSMTWTSFIGSTEGALKKADLWNGETYELMGMTGMAFHFIVHKTACPSSVTVYNWYDEHFAMLDRIGIYSRCISVMKNYNTSDLIMADTVTEIKESIDKGIPVVVWAPSPILEFGLVKGYDDQESLFYVADCMNENPDPLMYDNLGKSEVSILYYQRFLAKVEVNPEKIYRDSLRFGLEEWKKPLELNSDYARGKIAYDFLINTLNKGDYNGFGLSYLLAVYAESKNFISRYLKDIYEKSNELKLTEKTLKLYDQIAEKFKTLSGLIPFKGPGVSDVNKNSIPQALQLVKECKELETEAMNQIEKVFAE